MLRSEEYISIVENSPLMIWRSNVHKEFDYVNQTWQQFSGKTFEQESHDRWLMRIHTEDLERYQQIYHKHFEEHTAFDLTYRLLRCDGEYRWIHDRGQPCFDEANQFVGFVGCCTDVTEQYVAAPFKNRVAYDGLTGVYNRQQFFELATEEMDRVRINHSSMVLILLDVDGFRAVNDRYGFSVGDEVLKSMASVLKDSVRTHDLVGRFGGDEFMIGLTDTDLQGARIVCDRIVEKTYCLRPTQNDRQISVSVGVAVFEEDMQLEGLIKIADARLSAARESASDMTICYE